MGPYFSRLRILDVFAEFFESVSPINPALNDEVYKAIQERGQRVLGCALLFAGGE